MHFCLRIRGKEIDEERLIRMRTNFTQAEESLARAKGDLNWVVS